MGSWYVPIKEAKQVQHRHEGDNPQIKLCHQGFLFRGSPPIDIGSVVAGGGGGGGGGGFFANVILVKLAFVSHVWAERVVAGGGFIFLKVDSYEHIYLGALGIKYMHSCHPDPQFSRDELKTIHRSAKLIPVGVDTQVSAMHLYGAPNTWTLIDLYPAAGSRAANSHLGLRF